MRLLVLGGTVFLGRAVVNRALGEGHTVTLFNRGRSGPNLFPEAERITGDRDGGLAALTGREWDVVIDTCGYYPRIVRASAEALADRVGLYVFVSSISVYADFPGPGIDEKSRVGTIADPTVEEITGETYGPLKALCEAAVEETLPGRALVVRPGLIVGPHDPSDRFTYWVRRVAEGGTVLAPGSPDALVQFIDARDLGKWMLDAADRGVTGTHNATGPREPMRMEDLLLGCADATGSGASLEWADGDFLVERGVTPWVELPLWVPGADQTVSIEGALAAGLEFRPLAETVRDTLEWAGGLPVDRTPRAGITREREAELLSAWHNRPQIV